MECILKCNITKQLLVMFTSFLSHLNWGHKHLWSRKQLVRQSSLQRGSLNLFLKFAQWQPLEGHDTWLKWTGMLITIKWKRTLFYRSFNLLGWVVLKLVNSNPGSKVNQTIRSTSVKHTHTYCSPTLKVQLSHFALSVWKLVNIKYICHILQLSKSNHSRAMCRGFNNISYKRPLKV